MNVEFRKATFEDVEGIVNLCNECFFESTSLEYAINSFKSTINDPNQIYLIGVLDGKIIAHTKIAIISTMFEKMYTYAILNHVCVDPKYRKLSIATHMLEKVTKICSENNCVSIKLWSNNVDKRKAAHACYKKYGFEAIDTTFYEKEVK